MDESPVVSPSLPWTSPGAALEHLRASEQWRDMPAEERASLSAALTTGMASSGPMLLAWGPQWRCYYNAPCIPLLQAGHPALWGQPLATANPLLQQALLAALASAHGAPSPASPHHPGANTWQCTVIASADGRPLGALCIPDTWAQRLPASAQTSPSGDGLVLASAFDQSPAFLAVLRGPEHVFEVVNQRYRDLIGNRPLRGLPVREALPEVATQGFTELLDNVRRSGLPFVGESIAITLRRPGESEPYEAMLDFVYQPMRDADGNVDAILVHGVDVTEQSRAEARDSFLLRLEDALHGQSDAQAVIDTSVRMLCSHLGVNRCAYGAITADGQTMQVVSDEVQGMPHITGDFRLDAMAPTLREALLQDRSWRVDDTGAVVQSDAATQHRQAGLRASLAVPLHRDGRLVAAMGVHQLSPRHWSSEDVELVRRVLRRCWESLQRVRAQRRLSASEARLRQLADTVPQIMFVAGRDGMPLYFNQRWYDYTGIATEENSAVAWRRAHTAEGLRRSRAAWQLALAGERAYELECELRGADGTLRWHLVRALPVREVDGRDPQWIGTYTDIHDRRDFEQKLTESEARFRSLCETAPTMTWMADADGRCMYWSPQWHEFSGQAPEESVPDGWWSAVHPDDIARLRHAFEHSLDQRTTFNAEYRVRRSDGRYRWCVDTASPSFGVDGEFLGHIGSLLDITERKQIEDETASERSILSLITTGTALPLVLDAIALNVEQRSESALRCSIMLADAGQQQLLYAAAPHMPLDYSLHFGALEIGPHGPPSARAAHARHQIISEDVAEDAAWGEHQATALSMGIAAAYVTPIIGSNGSVLGTLDMYYALPHLPSLHEQAMARSASYLAGIVIERTLVDAQLQQSLQSEKSARGLAEHASRVKDEFLATLSHELRTPLNAILGWSRLMQAEGFASEHVPKGLATIERSARSQAQIIDDLLDMSAILSGKVRLMHEHLDLATLVRSTVELMRPTALAKQITLQALGADTAIAFFGDGGRLQQVLTNLLGNALKFTPADGTVTVSLAEEPGLLRLSVRDTGQGIASDLRPHVFDRFRQADGGTTRRTGGLGLGLSISRQLVDLHGGSLGASSAGLGHGATFTITLPAGERTTSHALEAPPSPSAAEEPGMHARLHGVRVLLVDDEDDAREATLHFLAMAGATVEGAGSADAAEHRLRDGGIDVLVSDIAMPDRDGYDLVRSLRASTHAGARIPAIALTAYVREEDRERAMLAGFNAHVGKPLDPVALIELIEILAVDRHAADAAQPRPALRNDMRA